jgi:MazG family protein
VSSRHSVPDAFNRLCEIMTHLRSATGCPWDRQQTPETLKPYIVEEAYELLDAIDQGEPQHIKEELGDLLLQIIFQAQIHDELALFNIQDVIVNLTNKLIRRHPHVFAPLEVNRSEHHELQWEQIKAEEKTVTGRQPGLISGIPKQLPALQAAQKIYAKLSRHGYAQEVITAPCRENQTDAGQACTNEAEARFARRLFQLIVEAQLMGVNAEDALRKYNSRLQHHFKNHCHPKSD